MEWTTTGELFEPTDEDIAVAGWNTEQLERLGIPEGSLGTSPRWSTGTTSRTSSNAVARRSWP